MAISAKLEGFEEVKRELKLLKKRGPIFTEVKKLFRLWVQTLMNEMRIKTSGQELKVRTGNLRRNWLPKVGGTSLRTLFASVENATRYIAIHQFGGIIKAVKSRYLTIPLSANKTASGVMRQSARSLINSRKTFFKYSKNKNLILFENRGKNNIVPMFVLKKQVKIPKRLTFFETADKLAKRLVGRLRGL